MPLSDYVTRARTVFLRSSSKPGVLREMLEVLRAGEGQVDVEAVMGALDARERLLSSRIAPGIALPHAFLPGYGKPLVAVGFSPDGVPWDSPGGERVNLVILSVCGREHGDEHVAMLADVANALRRPAVLEGIRRAASAEEVWDILQSPPREDAASAAVGHVALGVSRTMLRHARSLAREARAARLMIIAEEGLDLRLLEGGEGEVPLLVVCSDPRAQLPEGLEAATLLVTPGYGLRREHRVRLAFLFALSQGLIAGEDTVVCLSGEAGRMDVVEAVDVGRRFDVLVSLLSELEAGRIRPHVFDRVLGLAAALAREGREGRPLGTTFILGDYPNVQRRCYQLVINPFRGYAENERNVLDPGLEETIKEFSRIDGACLIRGDGVIMAFGAYIRAEEAAPGLQSGLGARHAAALAISLSTQAVSVVISESTGRVTVFRRGQVMARFERATR